MYEFCVVVPDEHADEVENVLQDVAEVRRVGTMPTPEEMAADEEWAIASGTPLAILAIRGPSLESISSLKNWLQNRFADPYVDVRAQDSCGGFSFSFHAHSAEEIKDWMQKQASIRPAAPGGT